jgi:copper chaperone CopZ
MKTVLSVKGMKCGGCETSVRDAVQALAGVSSVQPNFKENSVEVEFDEGQIDLETIRRTIVAKGFQA